MGSPPASRKEEMIKTSSKKFEITDIAHEKYPFLYRIRALRDVGIEVRAGDLGGFVEAECNLSQEEGDASWIFDDAIAAGSASVDKDSCLRDKAIACDKAYVTQRSTLSDCARAEDSAYIRGSVLSEQARASGTAMVLDNRDAGKHPRLSGQCVVCGTVAGAVEVTGTAVILWEEKIRNDTQDTLILDGLTCSYPIETVRGNYGGVRVADWFHLDRRALNSTEIAFLNRLGESLDGPDLEMLNRIIATFSH